ncbi:MAG TPA: NADH-quinone oxidoreductase subunit J [Candidatus Paceibacterota bacterium]
MVTVTFYIFSAFAIVSLWMMLRTRQLVHAIAWFAVFLIIIAIFFGLLRAPFLALGQLVTFTGGMVAILLIGISFSGIDIKVGNMPAKQGWYKIVSLFFLLTLFVSIKLFFAKNTMELPVQRLSVQLFGAYWPILAFIMLMFLAALLSAVYFLKKEEK